MYRVFRNIISQVIWARKFEERERGLEERKEKKYKQSDAKSSRT